MFSTIAIVFIQGFQCLVKITRKGYAESIIDVTLPLSVHVQVFYTCVSVQMLLSGLFFVPVLWLSIVQTGNFISNRTTMERFSRSN